MNIALGMIVKNERAILEKTLNHKAFWFDTKIAVDFMSNDFTNELLGLSYGFYVHRQEWKNNFALARNIVIQLAEEAGADYLFMLDADEAMLKEDIDALKELAEKHDVLAVPRYEFVQDFNHYDPTVYPDWQCRFFRLNRGYYFKNKLHEMLHDKNGKAVMSNAKFYTKVPKHHIYHYSKIVDRKRSVLKYVNYDRMSAGKPMLDSLPPDFDYTGAKLWTKADPFTNFHPLKNNET